MAKSRYEEYQSYISQHYNNVTTQINKIMLSDTAIQAHKVMDKAIKALTGTPYLFQLGLALIPIPGNLFAAVQGVKYTVTGVTFVLSIYQAYHDNNKDFNEKKMALRSDLDKVEEITLTWKEIVLEIDELLKSAGYEMASPKLDYVNIDIKPKKAEMDEKKQCQEPIFADFEKTRVFVCIKSILDGLLASKFSFDILKSPSEGGVLKKLLVVMIIVSISLRSYFYYKNELQAKNEYERAEKEIEPALNALSQMTEHLGSKAQLKEIMKKAEEATKQSGQYHDSDKKEVKKSFMDTMTESKAFLYMQSLLQGASVSSMLPKETPLYYTTSLITLLLGTSCSLKNKEAMLQSDNKMMQLDDKIQEAQEIIEVSKKILIQQQIFISQMEEESSSPEGLNENCPNIRRSTC